MFLTWATLRESCRRCGLRFEAQHGGFLGAMTLNYLFAMAVWLAVLVGSLMATAPDVATGPLVVASVAIMVVMPLLLAPTSKSVWAAVEFLVLRADPNYAAPVRRRETREDELE
jgi:hypothetical protein